MAHAISIISEFFDCEASPNHLEDSLDVGD
jgi:hypothetical protein